MTKAKLIILLGFVIAFGAGVVVAVLVRHAGGDSRRHGAWLTRELDLTPEQSRQMQAIWSGVMRDTGRSQEDRRRTIRKERDDAVVALLNDQQKTAYASIQEHYAAKTAELADQRSKAFQDAVERTRQILTETQRVKYDEMRKKWMEQGRGQGRRSEGRGSTRPASD